MKVRQIVSMVAFPAFLLTPLVSSAEWTVTGTVYNGGTVTLANGNWTLVGRTFTPAVAGDPFDFRIQTATASTDGTVLDVTDVPKDSAYKVRVAAFDYANVFKGNKTLQQFIAPDMTSVGTYAFQNCTALEKIVVSPDAVSFGEGPFCGCTALSDFSPRVFPKMSTLGGNVFDGCTALTGSFEFGEVKSFGNRVFADSGINMVKAPKLEKITASSSYPAFKNTPISGTLEFPLLKVIPRSGFDTCGMTGLKVVGCELVGQNGVSSCPNLEFMEFSNALTNIGLAAFANNPKLRSFKPLLPAGLRTLGNMAFQTCPLLQGPVVFRSPHVTTVPTWCFNACTNLTSVIFRQKMISFGDYAFSDVGPSCSLYFRKNADLVPTFGSQVLEAKRFTSPVSLKTRMYVYGGRDSAAWQTAVAPLATTFESYVKAEKADYPGARTFGLIKTGYSYEIANSWIVDWLPPGFSVILR